MAPPPVIRLHPDDNVVIARTALLPGALLGDNVVATQRVPAGHKAAVRAIAGGETVRRYGQIIGFASSAIAPGQHVHVHNCEMGDFSKDYAYGVDASD
jgi:altronate hydrolase